MDGLRINLFLLLLGVCGALSAAVHAPEDVPDVQVADSTRYVSNPDGVLSEAVVAELDGDIAALRRATTAEMAIVAVDDIDRDINDFATRLYELWGLGRKGADNGVLMVISTAQRKAVIRTGYGAEGVLPDAVCSRIIRNDMVPYFKLGDYDSGTLAAAKHIRKILTEPDAMAEMRRGAEDSGNPEFSGAGLFRWYISLAAGIALVLSVIVLYLIFSSRGLPPHQRWAKLNGLKPVALFLVFFGLGMPLVAYIPLILAMRRIRGRHRACPNCGKAMRKLDEEHDNYYLSPAQDLEEHLNSVDYDVWLCSNCGEKDVIPYANARSSYSVCPRCGAKACSLAANRVVMPPTVSHSGRGVRIYSCANCRESSSVPYTIAKLVAPVVVAGGGGFGGFGGSGGFGGGGFGGGMTGGGGASGGW